MTVTEKTVKDYVVQDFRTAAVFERHGLDFCCGGGQPLGAACAKKGLDVAQVMAELDAVLASAGGRGDDPNAWELDALTAHIVRTHHTFVRDALPPLRQHADKVARVHGERHPEMVRVAEIVAAVEAEMTMHMHKEEAILFPYIDELTRARREHIHLDGSPFGTIENPIAMMIDEHESAGGAMAEASTLTAGYTPPEDACMTYRVLLQELAAFEKDLHHHVHLENNILFPKAATLEGQLVS